MKKNPNNYNIKNHKIRRMENLKNVKKNNKKKQMIILKSLKKHWNLKKINWNFKR